VYTSFPEAQYYIGCTLTLTRTGWFFEQLLLLVRIFVEPEPFFLVAHFLQWTSALPSCVVNAFDYPAPDGNTQHCRLVFAIHIAISLAITMITQYYAYLLFNKEITAHWEDHPVIVRRNAPRLRPLEHRPHVLSL
jgi:hypothetical protein